MEHKIAFLILFVILLVGCGTPNPSASFASTEEITPIQLPPTWTPTITRTPPPSGTPIVVETFTPVPPLTIVPQVTNTTDPADFSRYIALPSPRGDWTAYTNTNEIKIVNTDASQQWTLPCELFERCQYILPIKWDHTGEVLFFGASSYLEGVPQPNTISFFSTAGKIDVTTGVWERLFPDPAGYFDFSVSPDDIYVAYTESTQKTQGDPSTVILTVLHLKNHREQKYTLGSGAGGNIVWSPYKERFVFQLRNPNKGSSLAYYDADLDVLRYIVQNEKSDYSIQSWLENNLVLLQKTDPGTGQASFWYLNPFTNQFSKAPAPVATP